MYLDVPGLRGVLGAGTCITGSVGCRYLDYGECWVPVPGLRGVLGAGTWITGRRAGRRRCCLTSQACSSTQTRCGGTLSPPSTGCTNTRVHGPTGSVGHPALSPRTPQPATRNPQPTHTLFGRLMPDLILQ